MGNIEENIAYDELIMKELSGEILPEEQEKLLVLINENSDIKQRYLDLKKIYNIASSTSCKEYGSEDAYNDFLSKTSAKKESGSIRKIIIRTLLTAASIAIVVGLWFIFNKQETIEYSEIVLAIHEKTPYTFEDSSYVFLNAQSSVAFPKTFSKKGRNVKLKGEAYFRITPNKDKPFSIETKDLKVTVLGTSFLVKDDTASKKTIVTVESGKVMVEAIQGHSTVMLEKGEQAIYNEIEGTLEKNVNNDPNYLAWKTGILNFNDTKLLHVVETLKSFYKEDIVIASSKITNCQLTAKYENYTLEDVFEMLELTFNITVTKIDNRYEITGESCTF